MRVSNMWGHRHTGELMGLYGPHSYSAQTSPWPETAGSGVFLSFPTLSMCCIWPASILLRCKRQVTKLVHKKGVSQEYLPTSIGCFTSILTTVREGMWWAKIEGVRLESCQVHEGGWGDLPIGVRLHENILPSGDSRGEKRRQQQWVEKCWEKVAQRRG